jgi:hypothetical protein
MNLLQGIDPLLELNVIWRKLGLLIISLRFSPLHRCMNTLSSACPSCSFTYCCVRAANGVKDALYRNQRC